MVCLEPSSDLYKVCVTFLPNVDYLPKHTYDVVAFSFVSSLDGRMERLTVIARSPYWLTGPWIAPRTDSKTVSPVLHSATCQLHHFLAPT